MRASRARRAAALRLRRLARARRSAATMVLIAAVGAGGAAAHSTGGASRAAAKSSPAKGSVTRSVLERGDRGQDVMALQRALRLRADGAFGSRTRSAVRRFQRRRDLTVDGVAGPATLRALGLSIRPRSARDGDATTDARQDEGSEERDGTPSATLRRIARCESGGNPRAVSADGRYRGKYQFSRATWRAMGGKGDPAKASEAEQDRRAAKLLARQGTSPWPSCG